ncbi:MAG: YjgN family protein [Pseudomonadota bacterium]
MNKPDPFLDEPFPDFELEDAPPVPRAVPAPPPPRPVYDKTPRTVTFQFTGTGEEYFRIWVVNLLLTVLTLGVYSAWAKVRRLQYFYRNTRVDNATFDYHGKPMAILKGRLLALSLVVAYKVAYELSYQAAIGVAVLLVALVPWLLARSFRFKMVNSSYRGLRFRFTGSAVDAYKMLSLFPILAAFTVFYGWNVAVSGIAFIGVGTVVLGLTLLVVILGTVPLGHYLLKRFQHNNAYFGQTPVFFDATPAEFFKIYAKAIGFLMLGSVSAGLFGVLTHRVFKYFESTMFGWFFTLVYGVLSAYAFYLFVTPYLQSRVQNLVWQHTELAGHRFTSKVKARRLLWIHSTNLLLVTLTCGLYKPFAQMRVMKYRVECLTLVPDGSLEEFMCEHAGDNAGALGQETGDLFDIEIAL